MPQPRRAGGGNSAAEKQIPSLSNQGYFTDYYLAHRLDSGLADLYAAWDALEKNGDPTERTRVRQLGTALASYRADAALTAPGADALDRETLDLGDLHADARRGLLALNDAILTSLGWPPAREAAALTLTTGDKTLTIPAAHVAHTSTGVLLVALDTVFATDAPTVIASKTTPSGRLVEPVLLNDKPAAHTALEAAQLIFTADEAPSYLLLVSGGSVTLLDRERWGEGISLGANLDDALGRRDDKPKGELATIAALFGAGAINPGDQAQSVLTSLLEKASTESAGVSKELRHGIRRSVELLANAVVRDRRERSNLAWMTLDPKDLTRQSLRYLYRIIVLLFAEARPELGTLPVDDPDYQAGYSVARLREVALTDLHTPHGQNARHIQQSLDVLFRLVNDGHDPDQGALGDDTRDLVFPGLRSTLFDPRACELLDKAHLHDDVLQEVIQHLCFTRERAGRGRQPVSYSTLGINQLGAVYEGLMAYSGFLATEPLYEIDKDGDPDNGSWVIPIARADEFSDDAFLKEPTPDGSERRVRYEEGDFVFRLSGRDRQRSASYYTPEVLTEFTVRHALDVLFEENPHLTATDILNLTVCEPALGSGAFLTEAIKQLAERYLKAAQDESGEVIDADQYQLELQRAKAHFAVNQAYGVDLNQTAVELAEVSLWLACMHEGLRAPWFGARLRRGNSLVGARREMYTREEVQSTAWAGKKATAPATVPIAETPLGEAAGIHHFLVPGQGWGAAADAKEIKELDPDWVEAIKQWRRAINRKPTAHQLDRLASLARRTEELWAESATEVERLWRATRQHIEVWGADTPPPGEQFGDEPIRTVLSDPRSATSRLRTLMDAWCSLWLWSPQHGTDLPTLDEWLAVADALLRVGEPWESGALFADERALELPEGSSIDDIASAHPWLASAREIAETQGWFHWELEFSPVFIGGGFDLQVGNPPWMRPSWSDVAALAEHDPWWAISDVSRLPADTRRSRRELLLGDPVVAEAMASERAELAGSVALLDARSREPELEGLQTNLYLAFITNLWRRQTSRGSVGLLHPESHFIDPNGGPFRDRTYAHLRRHWQFANGAGLFPEVGHRFEFSVNVYSSSRSPDFLQAVYLMRPATLDASLAHDGEDDLPAIQFPEGGWDMRPHAARVHRVDVDTLAGWVGLFDPPGTPPSHSRLYRPLTVSDSRVLACFSRQPRKLADSAGHWTRGIDEDKLKAENLARWETAVPESLDDCILQGPHVQNATPFAQEPRPNCRSKGDWDALDLAALDPGFVPRTNLQWQPPLSTTKSRQPRWGSHPYTSAFREAHREFVDVALMRTLQSCILPPGPSVAGSIVNIALPEPRDTALLAGLMSSVPYDYLAKVSGISHVGQHFTDALPLPRRDRSLEARILLRTLRLNALTSSYAPLWEELFDEDWSQDSFAADSAGGLGDVGPTWTPETPLRVELNRWRAAAEIDGLVGLLLGLEASDVVQVYRSQFAVLRKYETATVFDARGHRISRHHQHYGRLQADVTRSGWSGGCETPWRMVLAWMDGEDVDPGPFLPPFIRADRAAVIASVYGHPDPGASRT